MADTFYFAAAADCGEDQSVLELMQNLLDSHRSSCEPLEHLQSLSNAVLKFHQPYVINSSLSWNGQKLKHPILMNAKSSSLDLIITLICARKAVIDSVIEGVHHHNVYHVNEILLTTVAVMSKILANRCHYLAPHIEKTVLEIDKKKLEIVKIRFGNSNIPSFQQSPKLVARPMAKEIQHSVWKKLFTFTTYSGLRKTIADKMCSICINEDITGDDFAILDNCRHVFCSPCISKWFQNK